MQFSWQFIPWSAVDSAAALVEVMAWGQIFQYYDVYIDA